MATSPAREAEERARRADGSGSIREEVRAAGSAVAAVTDELFQLISKERQLAQAEMADSMSAARRAGMFGAVAAVLALLALGFLALSLMYGLDTFMPQWAAALATAGIVAVLAALVGWMARRALTDFTIVPKRTASSVKEDLRWANAQIRRNGTSPSSDGASASASTS
ncbi:MAG: phage holin family protein [Dehalococcoidia bacterium]